MFQRQDKWDLEIGLVKRKDWSFRQVVPVLEVEIAVRSVFGLGKARMVSILEMMRYSL